MVKKSAASKSKKARGITLRDVIAHQQHNNALLEKLILDSKKELKADISHLSKRVDTFQAEFRAFAKGTDDLDFRVQDIEEENLPVRMKHVETKLEIVGGR